MTSSWNASKERDENVVFMMWWLPAEALRRPSKGEGARMGVMGRKGRKGRQVHVMGGKGSKGRQGTEKPGERENQGRRERKTRGMERKEIIGKREGREEKKI